MPNYKPAFIMRDGEEPCTNGEVYATHKEALASAQQRFMVWTMPSDFTVVETDEPVNGKWVEGKGRVTDNSLMGHVAPQQVRIA